MSRRGFTLLELLISAAVLAVLLGVLGVVLHRGRSAWVEGSRRTALMTQGRAALEILAADLQNGVGTNVDVFVQSETYGATNNGLWLLRAVAAPRPGGADVRLPVEEIGYTVSNRSDGVAVLLRTRGRLGWAGVRDPGSTNVAGGAVRTLEGGGAYDVTNVVAGSGETYVQGGRAGETVDVPVNRESTSSILDWVAGTQAWLELEPTADPQTNLLRATVVFSDSFTRLLAASNSVPLRPAAAPWPGSVFASAATGLQAVAAVAATPGLAIRTNTFDQPVVHWRDAGPPAVATNLCWTGLLAFFTTDPTPPQAGWYDETTNRLTVPPVADLSFLPPVLSSATNTHLFPPSGSAWTNVPLALSVVARFDAALDARALRATEETWTAAYAAGSPPVSPLLTQVYARATSTLATNRLDRDYQAAVWQRLSLVTTNLLATLIPTNLVLPETVYDSRARREWTSVSRLSDTVWQRVTLDADFAGGPMEVFSLWLQRDRREASNVVYRAGEAGQAWVGSPPEAIGEPLADTLVEGVAAVWFQPLVLRQDGGELRLEPWALGDDGEPACVDVYLELVDPRVARRAAAMVDEAVRRAFVARHALRLSRRVALRPHNRWGEP